MSPYSLSSIVLVLIQKPRAVLSSYYDVINNYLAIKSLNCLYSSQTSLMKHTRFSLFTEFTSSFYKHPCFLLAFCFYEKQRRFPTFTLQFYGYCSQTSERWSAVHHLNDQNTLWLQVYKVFMGKTSESVLRGA